MSNLSSFAQKLIEARAAAGATPTPAHPIVPVISVRSFRWKNKNGDVISEVRGANRDVFFLGFAQIDWRHAGRSFGFWDVAVTVFNATAKDTEPKVQLTFKGDLVESEAGKKTRLESAHPLDAVTRAELTEAVTSDERVFEAWRHLLENEESRQAPAVAAGEDLEEAAAIASLRERLAAEGLTFEALLQRLSA